MDRPTDVNYFDLADSFSDEESRKRWIIAVGRCLAWVATSDEHGSSPPEANVFHQCWVADDLTLLLRYEHFSRLFGTQFGDVELDYVTSVPLVEARDSPSQGSSFRQAAMMYHIHLNGGPAKEPAWTDPQGYSWWGEEPVGGWRSKVESSPALCTVFP
ncbi:hypothetical protein [Actinopolyspora halophila]|uniref:hypothetical protein n=1 Tax=Actinopolyspora halophila TaxID=1850 RepID=UPI0012F87924|nr:hypothetical protein [Actinopolyspora halophila]